MSGSAHSNSRADDLGGSIIQSYKVSSWIVLRIYGAVFIWFSWIIWSGDWPAVALLAIVERILPAQGFVAFLAATGVVLFLPFLTPSTLRFPRTVGGGVIKAVVLTLLSGIIYALVHYMLGDYYLPRSSELAGVLPLFIKAVAGMAVTGAVLVSLALALRDGETRRDTDEAPPRMSETDLRALRRMRGGV